MEKIIQPSSNFCKHLGLLADPETSLTYPSLAHHCFRCNSPAIPLLEHQENYCLVDAHQSCPVFMQAQKGKFPKQYQAKKQFFSGRLKIFIVLISLFLLIGMFLFVRGPTLFAPIFPANQNPFFISIPQTKTVQPTDIFYPPSQTPSLTKTSTPTATFTPTLTATFALTPTVTPALHGLELPIQGGTKNFVIHRIAPGETLEKFIKNYATSSDVINYINYRIPTPLWADSIIILMPGFTVVDRSLPSFEAYQVKETEISIEDLAQKLQVEVATLKYYNNCTSGCRLFRGDWVLIPHLH